MSELCERFFILTPAPTGRTKKHPVGSNMCMVYLDAEGKEMLWSADFPIPSIGQRVFITLNGIGWAVVKGYFESTAGGESYVGVMTLATRPPKWLRQQHRAEQRERPATWASRPQWYREGIGCEFGTEIALKRPQQKVRPADSPKPKVR